MERLSIQGDYFECQLYKNRLYLWTFNGSLQVYNYDGILSWWAIERERHQGNRIVHRYEFEPSLYAISVDELKKFLICERDYLTSEFPTGTEIIDDYLFETNCSGLFESRISSRSVVNHIWDASLISINAAQGRGFVLSAGSNGLYWCPTDNRNIRQLSRRQSIDASFCSFGIYVQSSQTEPFFIPKDSMNDAAVIDANVLFKDIAQEEFASSLTWSWKNFFFRAKGSILERYKFSNRSNQLTLIDRTLFDPWKGYVVGGGSSEYGTMVELDNAAFIIEGLGVKNNCSTIDGAVTRWRFYPRSLKYKTHLHIIFDDRIDIVIMEL